MQIILHIRSYPVMAKCNLVCDTIIYAYKFSGADRSDDPAYRRPGDIQAGSHSFHLSGETPYHGLA